MTDFDLSRASDRAILNIWAFNVYLESGGEELAEVAVGGAILNWCDLDRILEWAREQANAIAETLPKGGDAKQAPCASKGGAVAKPIAQPLSANPTIASETSR